MKTCAEPRARQITRLDTEARQLRHNVACWAMATGTPVAFDALSIVLAAKSELPGPLRRWEDEDVWRLWWIDLSTWCIRHQIPAPADLAPTMRTLFAYLEANNAFEMGSHGRAQLCHALGAAGATTAHHPSATRRAPERRRDPESTADLHLA